MTRRSLATVALILALSLATPISAHDAAKGRNGGPLVDVGNYHMELLVDGTTSVAVVLSDADDRPIPSIGFKGTAILILDGKSQRIELSPADGSKLVGTAPAPVQPGVKGVMRLTSPDGRSAQGKL